MEENVEQDPVAMARQLLKQGDLTAARNLVDGILAMDPSNREAGALQDDIIRQQVSAEQVFERQRDGGASFAGGWFRIALLLAIGVAGLLLLLGLLAFVRGGINGLGSFLHGLMGGK
jgi:hypothetical protein